MNQVYLNTLTWESTISQPQNKPDEYHNPDLSSSAAANVIHGRRIGLDKLLCYSETFHYGLKYVSITVKALSIKPLPIEPKFYVSPLL